MEYQITHIRLSNNNATSTEKITHVRLSNGTIETVAQVVSNLEYNNYYYNHLFAYKTEVESVRRLGKPAYIRTKANNTIQDNLLRLPIF